MFNAALTVRAFSIAISLQHGDVVVLTSWWRRWLKKEKWGIAKREPHAAFAAVYDTQGKRVTANDLGRMDFAKDPDLWPDDVCAAVMVMKLGE